MLYTRGEPLEFVLPADVAFSDQGCAYDAVRFATAHCECSADVLGLRAREDIASFDVQYRHGVFSLEGVIRLVTTLLLYGVNVGACRASQGHEQ